MNSINQQSLEDFNWMKRGATAWYNPETVVEEVTITNDPYLLANRYCRVEIKRKNGSYQEVPCKDLIPCDPKDMTPPTEFEWIKEGAETQKKGESETGTIISEPYLVTAAGSVHWRVRVQWPSKSFVMLEDCAVLIQPKEQGNG